MDLISPQKKYQRSFLTALKEIPVEDRWRLESNKSSVPYSTFWLVDKNNFIGRVNIRHKLNRKLLRKGGHIGYVIAGNQRNKGYGTQILKLALIKAKKMGLKKVLVTCNENNLASKKVIEKNGGRFCNAIYVNSADEIKTLRYWINLT
jgi:predicted acetyltransferase